MIKAHLLISSDDYAFFGQSIPLEQDLMWVVSSLQEHLELIRHRDSVVLCDAETYAELVRNYGVCATCIAIVLLAEHEKAPIEWLQNPSLVFLPHGFDKSMFRFQWKLASAKLMAEPRKPAEVVYKESITDMDVFDFARNSPFGVLFFDRNGHVFFANLNAEFQLGYGTNELLGISVTELGLLPDTNMGVERLFENTRSGFFHLQLDIPNKGGFWVFSELYYIAISQDVMMVYLIDISEHKDHELELANYRENLEEIVKERTNDLDLINKELYETFSLLAHNNTFLENVIDNLPLGLAIFDSVGLLERTNNALNEMLDIDADFLQVGEFNVRHNLKAQQMGLTQVSDVSFRGLNSHTQEIVFRTHVTPRYFQLTSIPIFDNQGEVKNVVMLFNDLSPIRSAQIELQESELKLRNFIRMSPNGNVLTDAHMQLIIWNSKMEELFELSENEVLGVNLLKLYWQLAERFSKSRLHVAIREYLKDSSVNEPSEPIDVQYTHSSGKVFDLVVRYFKLPVPQGYILGLVIEDISDQKEAERKIQRALAKEQDLGEMKSAFVSMASHQFRTPMATILSSTELLMSYVDMLENPMRDRLNKHLAKIESQIQRLEEMITDFLLLGRIETGRTPISKADIDVVQLVSNIYPEHFSQQYPDRLLHFVIEGKRRSIFADSKLLWHIVQNLLSNAYKYSNDGPELALKFGETHLCISVTDHGIGVPLADQPRLFESFYRASNADTYRGTGLGLSIVKRLVEAHNGEIGFESTPQKGSRFWVSIPYLSA